MYNFAPAKLPQASIDLSGAFRAKTERGDENYDFILITDPRTQKRA